MKASDWWSPFKIEDLINLPLQEETQGTNQPRIIHPKHTKWRKPENAKWASTFGFNVQNHKNTEDLLCYSEAPLRFNLSRTRNITPTACFLLLCKCATWSVGPHVTRPIQLNKIVCFIPHDCDCSPTLPTCESLQKKKTIIFNSFSITHF